MSRRPSPLLSRLALACAAGVAALGLTRTGPNQAHANGRVAAFVEEQPPSRADLLRSAGGTYIGQLLLDRDSTLSRWQVRIDEPVRVWIEPSGRADFAAGVRAAFGEWTRVGLPLRFTFVDRARDAEIHVRWTDRLERKTGNTVWRVDRDGWMRGSDMLLATHLSDGRVLDERSLHAIALHEIGHAIGLPHSDSRQDVMAPLIRVASLSDADRATARLLYALPAGRLR